MEIATIQQMIVDEINASKEILRGSINIEHRVGLHQKIARLYIALSNTIK